MSEIDDEEEQFRKRREATCLVCGTIAVSLKDHLKSVHGNVQEWKCMKCLNFYKTYMGLRRHDRNFHRVDHMKLKAKVKCQLCGMFFHSLTEHIEEAHSQAAQEIEKYKCPNCPAEYRYYRNLRAHIKIHKFPDKYKCLEEGCKKVFETKGGLRKHLKFRHKISQPIISSPVMACASSAVPTIQESASITSAVYVTQNNLSNTENSSWPSQAGYGFN